ncbi:MAG TPA: DNRLRE domain-containing protein, partial [Candidatus Dormibacteraeota bacterium]|nr:DNRLRE domain-containing protein [Candidatus Dormibacteraeota bacterium]
TETGNLIRGIDGVIWTTGDNVYPNGTAAEFANCYETTPWGDTSVQSRTRPVPGNHDWGTGATENLNGYFGYYGANANAGGTSYYSYDVGADWHIVNLDSECQLVPGGCDVGSPQEVWLRADLAVHADQNVIAIWHKPRYSTGTTNYQAMAALWDAIYDAGVDILLDGHDHIYERTAPMRAGDTLTDPPVADPTYGIRQFTVGTGGEAHHELTTNVLPTSVVRNDQTFGILKLTLHATTYDWVFLPIAGSTFTDSGTGTVHDAPDTTAPPPPTIDSGPSNPTSSTSAIFTFSNTESGVTFECALDGAALATCTSPRNYSGLAAGEHSFAVRARDAAGNLSAAATHAWTIELPTTVTTTLRAIADSYTDASRSTTNYGTNVKLRVDGSPVVRSYLRFDLSSIPGTISSATLRIWALSSQSAGWTARSLTGSWTETGITHNNAPTLGTASVGSSGPVTTGSWTSVNVTALIGTGTTLDIGVNTASTTALALSSDESGAATAPQLVVISGGGPPPGDTEDPTMPGNLQATAPLSTQVHLTWTASTDNVGVTGYTIYRNGSVATTVGGTVTGWDDNGRTPSTTYTYAIEAFDAAVNTSPRTPDVSVTTPAGGGNTTTTLRSIADSYVDANNAGTNYGTSVKLRVDGSPAIRTYVRFDLSSLSGTISRATLRMWATSSQSSGWQARSVNGAWAELTLTSSNAPSLGAPIGSSGAVSAGSWTVVDVTALLSGGTSLNIGLTTTSTTALAMSSREAGTPNAPQLVVETTN